MPAFTIPGQTILANVESDSPSTVLASSTTGVQVQLTDPNSVWNTTPGNIKKWGIQRSADGGVTWEWFLFQGHLTNTALWLAFGSRNRQGGMPQLNMTGGTLVAAISDHLRLSILTDTDIVLGAQITVM